MTRLKFLHPYPAMVADELASQLINEHLPPGKVRFLDPFAGSGRLVMAAAENGSECVGIDVNPLANLIVRAKTAKIKHSFFKRILSELSYEFPKRIREHYDLSPGRSVEWFSPYATNRLQQILSWLNSKQFTRNEATVLAAVLSATARDVSYCRKDTWKLHRISEDERKVFRRDPWEYFVRRIQKLETSWDDQPNLSGTCKSIIGDALRIREALEYANESKRFNVVMTSPPYGDSRTTVQYGALSDLCLGVIRNIDGLRLELRDGALIDGLCLGGSHRHNRATTFNGDLKKYWRGIRDGDADSRMTRFAADLENFCAQIDAVTTRNATLVFILGRRSVGGWRFYIDEFLKDHLVKYDFRLLEMRKRKISKKHLPMTIDRYGRNNLPNKQWRQILPTMSEEIVLVFRNYAH